MTAIPHEKRVACDVLRRFATAALTEAGLNSTRAAIVTETLIEADLIGHSTHGLAYCPFTSMNSRKAG